MKIHKNKADDDIVCIYQLTQLYSTLLKTSQNAPIKDSYRNDERGNLVLLYLIGMTSFTGLVEMRMKNIFINYILSTIHATSIFFLCFSYTCIEKVSGLSRILNIHTML